MKNAPKAAFIIVGWNNEPILPECFDSIKNQTNKNHQTFFIDNDSRDNSVALVKEKYPWVQMLESNENLGFAKGNNTLIKRALEFDKDIEYFIFLNTDARVSPEWLDVMLGFASKKPQGAVFQSVTLDYYNHEVVDSTHIYISRNGSGTQSGWRTMWAGEAGPMRVFGANAAAAMVSRKFVEAQPFEDLFDERMFMYLEDVDLSARAVIMGWDNYLVPGTVAYHMGSASSGKKPGFSLYMTYRNNIALLAKNIPFSMLLKMTNQIILSDYHTIKHLRRINQAEAVPKVIKGRIVGFFRLPLFIPGIVKMRSFRKSVSKEYLWQLMRTGKL